MNIYEALKEVKLDEKCRLFRPIFFDDKKYDFDTDTDRKVYDIIKNIFSLALKITDKGVEFHPHLVWEEKRTFAIEDLTDDDYKLLNTIDLSKLPSIIRARVGDVLWNQKKDYQAAIIAAETYFELFNLYFNTYNWIHTINMIKRSIYISIQINKEDMRNNYCQAVYNQIMKINAKENAILSLSLMEIILDQSFGDFNKIIEKINDIITYSQENPTIIERVYILKAKLLNKLKKTELSRQANVDRADYFVAFAENILENDSTGVMQAVSFLKKAIQIYGNNKKAEEAQSTHKRLVEVEKDILKSLHSFRIPYDGDKMKKNITDIMKGLTFEETVIRLTQMIPFYIKEEFKNKVLEDMKEHPLHQLFTNNFLNEKGQTVFSLPPLDSLNPSKNIKILDLHIHRKMAEDESIYGNIILGFALAYIKDNFDIERNSFDFLVKDNAIIPKGRDNVIGFALYLAFRGHCYEALHILAPQVENIFRNIAIECGGLTVTLENDGTSKEKVLKSIFDIPELNDCYDNDILFMFKGLLNEQAGSNIRNNIAHGIMSEGQGNSGTSLFFVCATIKFLALYSRRCHETIWNNKEMMSEENIKFDEVSDDVLCEVDRKET